MLNIGLLLLAQVLADFPFQSNIIAERKNHSLAHLAKHLLILLIITLVLTFHLLNLNLLKIIMVLTILHGVIDFIKILLEKRWNQLSLEFFLGDQLLHITTIMLIIPFINKIPFNPFIIKLYYSFSDYYPAIGWLDNSKLFTLILFSIILIFNFKGGTIIVRKILSRYKADLVDNGDNKGKAIGNLERVLIIIFVLLDNYSLIGLLFTAKSLIRFKEIEVSEKTDGNFVEYYLIGTLSSLLIALISGVFLKSLI